MQDASNTQRPSIPSPSEQQPYSLQILLAEDNVLNQKLTLRQLQVLGHSADVVADGQAAVDAVARSPYDIVLMDCQMPGLNGFDATAAIREWEQQNAVQRSTPTIVVAMTASDLEQDRQRAIVTGMNDYLTKPIRKEMLEALLTRWAQVIRANVSTRSTATDSFSIAASDACPIDFRSHLNLINLHRLCDGCPEFELELLQVFIKDSYHHLHLLQQAIGQQNFLHIEQLAHHIKGSSANVGASIMQYIAEEIEQRSRQQQGNGLGRLVVHLEASLNHIQTFIQTQHKTCTIH
jgi:CheY-like chemotaxis protein